MCSRHMFASSTGFCTKELLTSSLSHFAADVFATATVQGAFQIRTKSESNSGHRFSLRCLAFRDEFRDLAIWLFSFDAHLLTAWSRRLPPWFRRIQPGGRLGRFTKAFSNRLGCRIRFAIYPRAETDAESKFAIGGLIASFIQKDILRATRPQHFLFPASFGRNATALRETFRRLEGHFCWV